MANQDQVLEQPATVTAKYKPLLGSGYLTLERQGEVELKFVRAPAAFAQWPCDRFSKVSSISCSEKNRSRKASYSQLRFPTSRNWLSATYTFNKGWAQLRSNNHVAQSEGKSLG